MSLNCHFCLYFFNKTESDVNSRSNLKIKKIKKTEYVLCYILMANLPMGWSGGAMVLGKLPVPGRPKIWMIVGQGPIPLAVGAGVGCLDILVSSIFYFFSLSLGDGPID